MSLHGWLVIDKPVGLGSTSAVSAVKRALREGGYPKAKVGHGGTLDPLASGVLPIALGEATKLCGRMLTADKLYELVIRFGEETDTLDGEGQVIATSAVRPSLAQVEAVLPRFTGEIEQAPPSYSALKVGGRRAYAIARAGGAPDLKQRRVIVRSLSSRAGQHGGPLEEIALVARVSKGTYVRALARDVARAAGTVGRLASLCRLQAGPFAVNQAIMLDKLHELATARQLEQALLPLTAGLDDIPALPVTPDQARLLRQGRKTVGTAANQGLHLATDRSVPVALVEAEAGGKLRVVRGFNL